MLDLKEYLVGESIFDDEDKIISDGTKDLSKVPPLDSLALSYLTITKLEDLPKVKDTIVLDFVKIGNEQDRRISAESKSKIRKITGAKTIIIS